MMEPIVWSTPNRGFDDLLTSLSSASRRLCVVSEPPQYPIRYPMLARQTGLRRNRFGSIEVGVVKYPMVTKRVAETIVTCKPARYPERKDAARIAKKKKKKKMLLVPLLKEIRTRYQA